MAFVSPRVTERWKARKDGRGKAGDEVEKRQVEEVEERQVDEMEGRLDLPVWGCDVR